ncbi:MAG: galactose-1-phosphate uridylyltransferase [Bryobacterales bacterium]|nr:galactose-1-phosphate uridylyltransferase [Bryobacterales bacterium]
MSELRWHPLLREWVVLTTNRQGRPQMPENWCPFCPGSGRVPEHYDVYLYPNDFPAFSMDDPDAPGACDVVLYSPEHHRLPSQLPLSQWEKIVALWTRRTAELWADSRVKHVAVFENTGEAVGVTMPHPHGQIYAFPFVPPRVEREWQSASQFRLEQKRCLHCDVLRRESEERVRMVAENASFTAFVPSFARFPYEMQLYLKRHARSLPELTDDEARSLAEILLSLRKRYDGLFGKPMPLMMMLHQTMHFYVEFLPLQRSADKLKYLASVESSLGTFLEDVSPEGAAEALPTVPV